MCIEIARPGSLDTVEPRLVLRRLALWSIPPGHVRPGFQTRNLIELPAKQPHMAMSTSNESGRADDILVIHDLALRWSHVLWQVDPNSIVRHTQIKVVAMEIQGIGFKFNSQISDDPNDLMIVCLWIRNQLDQAYILGPDVGTSFGVVARQLRKRTARHEEENRHREE